MRNGNEITRRQAKGQAVTDLEHARALLRAAHCLYASIEPWDRFIRRCTEFAAWHAAEIAAGLPIEKEDGEEW